MGLKSELVVAGRPENLKDLLEFIEDACQQAEADRGVCFDVKLAVEEACTNIILHGYADKEPGPIKLTLEADDHRIRVSIEDNAPAFAPDGIAQPDLQSDWQEREVGGLGWHLIRQVMDETHYRSDPEKGNRLTLVKRRSPNKP